MVHQSVISDVSTVTVTRVSLTPEGMKIIIICGRAKFPNGLVGHDTRSGLIFLFIYIFSTVFAILKTFSVGCSPRDMWIKVVMWKSSPGVSGKYLLKAKVMFSTSYARFRFIYLNSSLLVAFSHLPFLTRLIAHVCPPSSSLASSPDLR